MLDITLVKRAEEAVRLAAAPTPVAGPSKQPRSAVIIKGNPRFVHDADGSRRRRADEFYTSIESLLRDNGYGNVSFDAGEPYTLPMEADLWVGHSRGAGRLRFAPERTKTIALGSNLPDAINHPDDDVITKFHEIEQPPPAAHFQLTPEMISGLLSRASIKAASVIAHITGPSGFGYRLESPKWIADLLGRLAAQSSVTAS